MLFALINIIVILHFCPESRNKIISIKDIILFHVSTFSILIVCTTFEISTWFWVRVTYFVKYLLIYMKVEVFTVFKLPYQDKTLCRNIYRHSVTMKICVCKLTSNLRIWHKIKEKNSFRFNIEKLNRFVIRNDSKNKGYLLLLWDVDKLKTFMNITDITDAAFIRILRPKSRKSLIVAKIVSTVGNENLLSLSWHKIRKTDAQLRRNFRKNTSGL